MHSNYLIALVAAGVLAEEIFQPVLHTSIDPYAAEQNGYFYEFSEGDSWPSDCSLEISFTHPHSEWHDCGCEPTECWSSEMPCWSSEVPCWSSEYPTSESISHSISGSVLPTSVTQSGSVLPTSVTESGSVLPTSVTEATNPSVTTVTVLADACTTVIFCNPANTKCPNQVPSIASKVGDVLASKGGYAVVNGSTIVASGSSVIDVNGNAAPGSNMVGPLGTVAAFVVAAVFLLA